MELTLDVPYRCPRCGARTFSTLAELKSHVAEEHAYGAHKRQRLRIFDYNPQHSFLGTGRHSPLLQSFFDEGDKLEEEVKTAKKEEFNNKIQRHKQASSQSKAVKTNIQASSPAQKTRASPRKLKVNFHTPPPPPQEPDAFFQETVSQLNQEVLVQRQQQWRTADALYSTQDVLSGVEEAAEGKVSEQKNFILELTQQLADKERQLLELRTELEMAKDAEREKGQSERGSKRRSSTDSERADNIGREKELIEQELVKKKLELENLNKQIASARQNDNRRKLQGLNGKKRAMLTEKNRDSVDFDETKDPSRDNQNTDVSSQNSEGSDCSTTQESVNISRTSSSSTKDRSNHIKQLKHNWRSRSSEPSHHHSSLPHRHHNKLQQDDHQQPTQADRLRSQKLKEERKLLVKQMKDLLSKATTDNEKLKDELIAKENQLQFLNQELERTKLDQTELMEETYDLYKVAEKSLGELKERLKVKETQLDQANNRLEEIRTTQDKLLAEKEQVAKTSDDKDLLYQNMMRDREEQIQTLNGLLLSQQEERERLRGMAEELKQEVEKKEQMQQQLDQAISSKEEELAKAKEDVETLSQFLQTAAAKESVARSKLEAFVTELIDRADRAEKELKRLRGFDSSGSSGNLTSDPSLVNLFPAAGLTDLSAIPEQSAVVPGAGPYHSTPMAPKHRRRSHGSRMNAEQILQASLEPWYNDMDTTNPSVSNPMQASGHIQHPENPLVASRTLSAPSQVPQQQNQPLLPEMGHDQLQRQPLSSQPIQWLPAHQPVQQLASQQLAQQMPSMQQVQQLPPNQQIQQVSSQPQIQQLPPQQQLQQLPPNQQIQRLSSQQQLQQLPSQQWTPQPLSSQPVFQPPPAHTRHQPPPEHQKAVNQAAVANSISAEYSKDPSVEVYTIQPVPPLPLSESSEDFVSSRPRPPPGPPSSQRGNLKTPQHVSHLYPRPDSAGEESSAYAALPKTRNGLGVGHPSNTYSTPKTVTRQSPAYDGGDEQVCSDCPDSHPKDNHSQENCNFVVNSSGKVLSNGNSKTVPSSPHVKSKQNSQTPAPAHKSKTYGVPDRHLNNMVDNLKNDSRSQVSSKSISPDKTYSIYCVTGVEAKEFPSDNLSDSTVSHQDTPHFNKAIIDRKPRYRGKVKASSAQLNNKHASRLYRYIDDSSTDGLELSVDENGIMWEAVESFSDASESHRISPYGSETTGDVDSSVLLSSRSPKNHRVVSGRQDTDEDVDSLDDDGILRPSGEGGSLSAKKFSREKPASQLPLGERITRILKCVGRDEDSESLDLLIKQNREGAGKVGTVNGHAESVYGTGRRTPRHQPESPLQRALAVQNRVQSLTYPRAKKKTVTISDTTSSDLIPRPPAAQSARNVKPVSKLRNRRDPTRPSPMSAKQEAPVNLDLEDFSSSSYASVPPTPASRGTTQTWPEKTTTEQDKAVPLKTESLQQQGGNADQQGATVSLKQTEDAIQYKHESAINGFSVNNGKQVGGVLNLSPSSNLVAGNDVERAPLREKEEVRAGMDLMDTAAGKRKVDQHSGRREISLESSSKLEQTQNQKTEHSAEKLTKSAVDQTENLKPQHSEKLDKGLAEPQGDHQSAQPDTTTVKRQSSTGNVPLTRQASISADESDVKKFATAPLKPAKELRARFAQSSSQSSMQSSETESMSVSPPLPLPPPLPLKDKVDDDSTDFDLESDFEKLTVSGRDGEMRKGVAVSKMSGRREVQKKLRMRKMSEGRQSRLNPGALDDSGSNVSDTEISNKAQRREEARRRRVALFCVFSYLDTRTLSKMSMVCKEWKRVSRHPTLWKNVHLKYERVSSQFMATLAQWCTQLTSLTLEGLRSGSRRSSETMDEYHRRTKGCLEPGLEELLKASQDSLTSLSIVACGNVLTDKCMWLVSGYCRLLQRLIYLSDTHPLTAEVMWALGGGCPSITSLLIPPLFPCHNPEGMNNRCLMLIAQFYPDLQEIGVGGQSVDITGLVPLVQSCQRLHYLSVDHIKEMKDDSATALCRAGLRQLQRLELSGTSVTANALKTFYSSCRHLKEIRVFICVSDCFEDVRKKKNKEEYKKIVKSLEELKSQPGLGNILQLRAAPVD